MAFETIVVAFSTAQQATSAIHALRAFGIPASDIKRHPTEPVTKLGAKEASAPEGGIWEWFFSRPAKLTAFEWPAMHSLWIA